VTAPRTLEDSPEVTLFVGAILRTVDRIIACLDGLDEEELNWRPPAEGANSLYAIGTHLIANVEENFVGFVGGRTVKREREQEFAARGSSGSQLQTAWRDVQEQIHSVLRGLPASDLDREISHPRAESITVRALLLRIARHSAEHFGHAELTRDLLKARRLNQT
jgi:DinB superfamily